jgi:hypothetical protein
VSQAEAGRAQIRGYQLVDPALVVGDSELFLPARLYDPIRDVDYLLSYYESPEGDTGVPWGLGLDGAAEPVYVGIGVGAVVTHVHPRPGDR